MRNDHSVAYGSYALPKTQQRYSPMEKMLAVVIGCRQFRKYIFGAKNVQIISDHKPPEEIFKDLAHTPAWLMKISLQLKKCDNQMKRRPGNWWPCRTRCLGHIFQLVEELDPQIEVEVNVLCQSLPITDKRYSELQQETLRDKELMFVKPWREWPRR